MSIHDNEQLPVDVMKQHNKMFQDMYYGNGKSSITNRLQSLEDSRDEMEDDVKTLRESLQESNKETKRKVDRLSWIVAIGVGIIATLQFFLKH